MKRIVTICLVVLLLASNYAYATLSIQEVSPTIKAALNEKQIQQQIEELFAEIIMSIIERDGIEGLALNELSSGKLESVAINPNQEFTGNPITDIILLLVNFIVQLAASLVNGIVYAVTWIVQVVVSIVMNFPEVLVNVISFIVNLLLGVVEIILGGANNLLFYLIPIILTVITYIIDIDDIIDDLDLVN